MLLFIEKKFPISQPLNKENTVQTRNANIGYIKLCKMRKEAAFHLLLTARYALHFVHGPSSTPLLPCLDPFQQVWRN